MGIFFLKEKFIDKIKKILKYMCFFFWRKKKRTNYKKI